MAAQLSRDQVAALLGVTVRRVTQMDVDGTGPPRGDGAKYPAQSLGAWFKARYEGNDRERLLKAQADKAELEAEQLRGTLLPTSETEAAWTGLVLTMRARLLLIPQAVAAKIAPPGKVAEVQAEIERLVYEALLELADGRAN